MAQSKEKILMEEYRDLLHNGFPEEARRLLRKNSSYLPGLIKLYRHFQNNLAKGVYSVAVAPAYLARLEKEIGFLESIINEERKSRIFLIHPNTLS